VLGSCQKKRFLKTKYDWNKTCLKPHCFALLRASASAKKSAKGRQSVQLKKNAKVPACSGEKAL
jgi:hypothetical protein